MVELQSDIHSNMEFLSSDNRNSFRKYFIFTNSTKTKAYETIAVFALDFLGVN